MTCFWPFQIWFNEDCKKIGNIDKHAIGNISTAAYENSQQLILFCTDEKNCSKLITVITNTGKGLAQFSCLYVFLQSWCTINCNFTKHEGWKIYCSN